MDRLLTKVLRRTEVSGSAAFRDAVWNVLEEEWFTWDNLIIHTYSMIPKKNLHFVSTTPLTFPVLADLLAQDRLFLNWPSSSLWPGCEAFTECLLGVSGLELPFDRPETETDIDIDIEVDADTEVEMEAKLPALSQSLDLLFPFTFVLGLIGHLKAAAASASLDVPVNVDTGLVFVEAKVCVSKLVKLLNEAAELSWPWIGTLDWHAPALERFEAPGRSVVSTLLLARVWFVPRRRPSLMWRSDWDDFLVLEDNGFTQPPSSSGKRRNTYS